MRAALALFHPSLAPARARLRWLAGCLPLLAMTLALLWPAVALHAQPALVPVPALSGRVIDQTGTLTPEQAAALDAKLAGFEAQQGPQIVVVIVPTTQPEDITDFTQRLGDAWKIGRREVGDGLLLVVAKNDRKVRIAPAKALEGAVPDLAARQIIERTIVPAFRANDYAGGLQAAVDALIARIRGENLPAPEAAPAGRGDAQPGPQWEELMLFFFIGVPVVGAVLTGVLGRKLGSVVTAGAAGGLGWLLSASLLMGGAVAVVSLVLVGLLGVGSAGRRAGGLRRGGRAGIPPIIFGGGGFGGGSGGFGGGGFSSGGGGDFGGGGASGDW
ncbi:TPM domain-containing protein [Aquincola tertiaricarbonis]|uniref:TPM domain-containing protein n=1 Tax=Aquincola tertiaricarbonis TaxID=391953 RepID=UPI0009F83968|nr:TPM domain-containing protein [Aquincola tertiaricarbonis]